MTDYIKHHTNYELFIGADTTNEDINMDTNTSIGIDAVCSAIFYVPLCLVDMLIIEQYI